MVLVTCAGLAWAADTSWAAGWAGGGSMNVPRSLETATLLRTNGVLVAGGDQGGTAQNAAELYIPATKAFRREPPMGTAREVHTATVLQDGRVLVVGGKGADRGAVATTEVFDPSSETWSPGGALATARNDHTATLLQDGRVLIAGGATNGPTVLSSAEIFDPGSGTWSTTGSMAIAREDHTASLLPDGRVLVAGGDATDNGSGLSSAELYDPTSGQWSLASSMSTPRIIHTASVLNFPDGIKVLVAGGRQSDDPTSQASTEVYDPASDTWTPSGSMTMARNSHTATTLANGMVLVAGGVSTTCTTGANSCTKNTAEVYDPVAGSWTAAPNMAFFRTDHIATLLSDGSVFVVGGRGNQAAGEAAQPLASAEIYQP